jgi:hypothetical protein
MSDQDLVVLLAIQCATLGVVAISFAVAWVRTRARLNRAQQRSQADALASGDTRFDRLEQAVESIAIEVERISEGQRFTAKLLSERATAMDAHRLAPADPGRVITPH